MITDGDVRGFEHGSDNSDSRTWSCSLLPAIHRQNKPQGALTAQQATRVLHHLHAGRPRTSDTPIHLLTKPPKSALASLRSNNELPPSRLSSGSGASNARIHHTDSTTAGGAIARPGRPSLPEHLVIQLTKDARSLSDLSQRHLIPRADAATASSSSATSKVATQVEACWHGPYAAPSTGTFPSRQARARTCKVFLDNTLPHQQLPPLVAKMTFLRCSSTWSVVLPLLVVWLPSAGAARCRTLLLQ